jgi:WD40 repeat protein
MRPPSARSARDPTTAASESSPTAVAEETPEVFISYAREDAAFAERLYKALSADGRTAYLDTRGIPVWSPDWQGELYEAIEKADAFVLLLSPASLASPNVALELKHAAAQGKRIKPLLLIDLGDAKVDEAVTKPQWIDFRDEQTFDQRFADLIGFLDTDVDWVRKHTRFTVLANDWDRRQRDQSLLLGRTDLREAEAWLADRETRALEPPPSTLQLEFIEASREQAARRRRNLRVAAFVVAIVVAGLGAFGITQLMSSKSNARSAQSRQLAARAAEQVGTDPAASLRDAIRAARVAPTAQAVAILRQAVTQSFETAVMHVPGGDVTESVFSPDGRTIATRSRDGTIRTWDAHTARQLARLSGGFVNAFAFDERGRLLTVAKNVQTWDARTGKLIKTLDAGISGGLVAIDPRAGLIAAGGSVGGGPTDVGVWSLKTGRQLAILRGHTDVLRSVSFNSDGTRLLTAGFDRTAREWDPVTGRQIAKMTVGESVNSAEFNSDATRIVTGDAGGLVRIFDAATGKQLQVMKGHSSAVVSAAFSSDGTRVLSASLDHTARLWDVATGFTDRTLEGHTDSVGSATYSPDGRLIVTASADETARVWDAVTGSEVAVLRGHRGGLAGAEWSPNSRSVVTSSADGTARIWDVNRGDRIAAVKVDPPASGIAFALGGKELVSAEGYQLRIRRPLTGALVREIPTRGRFLISLSVSPDGRFITTDADHGDVQLWNATNAKQIADFGQLASLTAAPFSGDSRRIAIVHENSADVRDSASGRVVTRVGNGTCTPITAAIDRHGDLVVTACPNNNVLIWRISDRHVVGTLQGHRGRVTSAIFSPDGRQVLTTSTDLTARLWKAATGRQESILRGHTSAISDASFSPDGELVVTASYDETARIWDAANGRQRAILRGGPAAAVSAAFSADGSYVLAAFGDGTARVFASPSGDPVETFRGHSFGMKRAVFSPDGRYIASIAGDRTARIFRCLVCTSLAGLLQLAEAELPHEAYGRK